MQGPGDAQQCWSAVAEAEGIHVDVGRTWNDGLCLDAAGLQCSDSPVTVRPLVEYGVSGVCGLGVMICERKLENCCTKYTRKDDET